ncbi:unnamed protein product, partial [Symbiodinium sp. CCMP2456]
GGDDDPAHHLDARAETSAGARAVENEAAADPADPTKTGTAAETAAEWWRDREDNSRGYSLVSSRGSGSRGRKGGNKNQKGHGRRSREGKKAWWDAKAEEEEEEEEVFGPFGQIPAFKVHPDGLGLHLLHNSGCQSKQLEIETGQERDRTFTCKKCNKRFWTEWDLEQHAGRCSWAVAEDQDPVGPRPELPPTDSAADSAEPPTRLRVYADLVELGKNLLR